MTLSKSVEQMPARDIGTVVDFVVCVFVLFFFADGSEQIRMSVSGWQ